tara:strand:- start:9798 stop:10943 length:1146 start_codon:yes stop_codon:yes gene_type:complete
MTKYLKIIFYLTIILFWGCKSPSETSAVSFSQKNIYETDTYCVDVDVSDSTIVLAVSNGGYLRIKYELDSSNFPVFTEIIPQQDHSSEYNNDSIDRVILSNSTVGEGVVYMLDKYSGGSSGIWFDNENGISIEPGFTNDYCYQGKYLDITLDESEPDNFFGYTTHIIYSLMKHTDLNENSDDDEFLQYSTSLVKRQINIVPNSDSGTLQSIDLVLDDCNYISNLSYDSKEINYNHDKLVVANETEGVIVFEKNESQNFDRTLTFNKSGGEAQCVLALENAVIGGFSNDKGCYMALLESDANIPTNLIDFAEGYSVKGIDYDNGIIGLATGSDGVKLYQWQGGEFISPYANLDTEYAYDLKIKGNLIYIATRQGLEIYKIGS